MPSMRAPEVASLADLEGRYLCNISAMEGVACWICRQGRIFQTRSWCVETARRRQQFRFVVLGMIVTLDGTVPCD